MYRSHFGMNQSPFNITPNPAFFFPGSQRGDILDALVYAVAHGEGIIKVTGEVGSGKTMLCRMLEDSMPANVEVIFMVNPTLSREAVLYMIAGELNLSIEGKRPDEVIRLLHQDLIAKHINGKQVVLLIEEAQAMPLETLEEIRLFSNLETAHHKLLQIVLFGQPELDDNLNLPNMRQLKERITHSFKMPPMSLAVIPDFLMFRMRAAGYRGPDVFSKGAIKLLAKVSQGIVRRINILADKSLLAAFADNTHLIQVKHVKAAIQDSEFVRPRVPLVYRYAAVAVACVAFISLALFVSRQNKPSTSPALPRPTMSSAKPVSVKPLPVPQAVVKALASNALPVPAVPDMDASAKRSSALTAPARTAKIIDESQYWLGNESLDHYTIQLALIDARDPLKIEQFLKKLETEVGVDMIHIYPTRIGDIPRFGIMYSSFSSREKARQTQAELESKWGYHAQMRTIGGIRAEIQRSQSKDLWKI